jgi:type IV pilus assembly protein PilC
MNRQDATLFFCQQLRTSLTAGLSPDQACRVMLAAQDRILPRAMIESLLADIRRGLSLAKSLAKFPNYFDALFIALIKVGEDSGTLEVALKNLTQRLETMRSIRKKIANMMLYPSVVCAVAIFLMLWVGSYRASHGVGPEDYWHFPAYFMMTVATLTSLLLLYKNSIAVRNSFANVFVYLPVLGDLIRDYYTIAFMQSLNSAYCAGLPLDQAVKLCVPITPLYYLQNALKKMQASILAGDTLANSMQKCNCFPNDMLSMISIGESSGSIEILLNKLITYYLNSFDYRLHGLLVILKLFLLMVMVGIALKFIGDSYSAPGAGL